MRPLPRLLCDTLLRLAEAGAYRALWSADVLSELRRNLIEAGIAADRVDYRIGQIRETFPGTAVTGYESLIEAMTNNSKDRHVLAAAVRANAEVIVTFNTSDFPEYALKDYEVTAVHPDDFLLDQLDLYPEATLDVMHQQVAAYRHEPTTLPGLLVRLERSEIPRFAAEIRRHLR